MPVKKIAKPSRHSTTQPRAAPLIPQQGHQGSGIEPEAYQELLDAGYIIVNRQEALRADWGSRGTPILIATIHVLLHMDPALQMGWLPGITILLLKVVAAAASNSHKTALHLFLKGQSQLTDPTRTTMAHTDSTSMVRPRLPVGESPVCSVVDSVQALEVPR